MLTGDEATDNAAAEYMGGTKILSTVLLAFGAIAVVVAALVIANTFAVLLAARTQELALLRCVGATAKQVRRSIRSEAAAVGVIASVIGVGLGVGLAWAIGRVATAADVPVPLSSLSVTPVTVLDGRARLGRSESSVRTGLIALWIAERLGLPLAVQRDLYFAAMVKDVGCSSNASQVYRLFGSDDLCFYLVLFFGDSSFLLCP